MTGHRSSNNGKGKKIRSSSPDMPPPPPSETFSYGGYHYPGEEVPNDPRSHHQTSGGDLGLLPNAPGSFSTDLPPPPIPLKDWYQHGSAQFDASKAPSQGYQNISRAQSQGYGLNTGNPLQPPGSNPGYQPPPSQGYSTTASSTQNLQHQPARSNAYYDILQAQYAQDAQQNNPVAAVPHIQARFRAPKKEKDARKERNLVSVRDYRKKALDDMRANADEMRRAESQVKTRSWETTKLIQIDIPEAKEALKAAEKRLRVYYEDTHQEHKITD